MTSKTEQASTIQELEDQIAQIKAKKKGNRTTEASRAKKIQELEKLIQKQKSLEDYHVGDYVSRINDPMLPGRIESITEHQHSIECQVVWEPRIVDQLRPRIPESLFSDVLARYAGKPFEWEWVKHEGAGYSYTLQRQFDNTECNDLKVLFSWLKKVNDEEKIEYLRDRYNEIFDKIYNPNILFDVEGKPVALDEYTIDKELGIKVLLDDMNSEWLHDLEMFSLSKEASLDLKPISKEKTKEPEKDSEGSFSISIKIDELEQSRELQQRVKYDQDAIQDYQQNLDNMPPVKVKKDKAGRLWVYDGYHTIKAFELAGREVIPCEVTEGEYIDAFRSSLGVNTGRGVRLTRRDRRKAIIAAIDARDKGALVDEQGTPLSNNKIAELLGDVHRSTVDNVVNELRTGKTKYEERQDKQKKQEQETETSSLQDSETVVTEKQDDSTDPWEEGAEGKDGISGDRGTYERVDVDDTAPMEDGEVFERPDKPLAVDDVVRIASHAQSKALQGTGRQPAILTAVYEHSVDLLLMGGKEITSVPKHEVSPTGETVQFIVKFDKGTAKQVIQNFHSLEVALQFALEQKKQSK